MNLGGLVAQELGLMCQDWVTRVSHGQLVKVVCMATAVVSCSRCVDREYVVL